MEVKKTVDEVVGIGKEVQGFWSKLFGSKPKPTSVAVVSNAKKKEQFVAVDETQVMVDVVAKLTEFFKLQEQLAAHIREEEEKSQTVYDPEANLMEAALKRVMAMDQMAELEKTIRETMVYQSPPEMGALYSKVFEMRDIIGAEQEAARLVQEKRERLKRWQRQVTEQDRQRKLVYSLMTLVLIGYLWILLLSFHKYKEVM
jgi:uncharacterized protein YdaU (DUF1376 family)